MIVRPTSAVLKYANAPVDVLAIGREQGVDAILHAGDIGGDHVIEALRRVAPVTFVLGNNDDSDGYDIVRATIGSLRILLTHIYRPELLQQEADVIVFGHSHRPHNKVIDGVLLFNPASAGPRRFKLPVMLGMIEGKRAYHIDLAR